MPDTITPEDLERRVKLGLFGVTHATRSEEAIANEEDVKRAVEDASHTIRELEKRAVPDGWEYRSLQRIGRPDISISFEFLPIPSNQHRFRWFWQVSDTGACGSCETAQDAILAAEEAEASSA